MNVGPVPISHLPTRMSFLQAPECIHHQEPSCKEPLLSTTFFHEHGTLREEENMMTNQTVERFVQHKLSTYQAAAVVVRTAPS